MNQKIILSLSALFCAAVLASCSSKKRAEFVFVNQSSQDVNVTFRNPEDHFLVQPGETRVYSFDYVHSTLDINGLPANEFIPEKVLTSASGKMIVITDKDQRDMAMKRLKR